MKTSTGFVVALLVCALAGIGAFGCNTFRGAGKDIQKGGKAMENAADDAQYREGRQHMIMASAESGGSISPSGSTATPYGSDRTFAIRAYDGNHVSDVLVDGKSVGAVSRHTFTNVTASHTISASFAPNSSR